MYRCPTHNTFRTLKGWTFHSSWCEAAWGVCEAQILTAEARKAAKVERPGWAVGKSTRAVRALARSLGRNPHDGDWTNDIDPETRADFMGRKAPAKFQNGLNFIPR